MMLAGVALVAMLAVAEPSGLEINPLAQGITPEHHIRIHVKGPSDILQTSLVFSAGRRHRLARPAGPDRSG
jgi:hypothetical protein